MDQHIDYTVESTNQPIVKDVKSDKIKWKKKTTKFPSFWKWAVNKSLKNSTINKEYRKALDKIVSSTSAKTFKKWETFGETITKIPEHGWSEASLKVFMDKMATMVEREVGSDEHYSGAIYSYSFKGHMNHGKTHAAEATAAKLSAPRTPKICLDKDNELYELTSSLVRLYSHSFQHSYLWNLLHEKEFAIGYWIQYQVIRMIADMYGGDPEKVMGNVTTGGTESLMNAVRMYRDWGVVNRNHRVGEGVILACESVHAGILKGAVAYNVKVELLPVDSMGKFHIPSLKRAVKRFGRKVIAIVGSTPSYTLGVIDPIEELAQVAKNAGVGLHVDSCLGGFIINFLDEIDHKFLEIEGVTSISCDTHKNGWAPKGSSVLITQDIPDKVFGKVNLAYYGTYAFPGWDGGIYGTSASPGSQPVTPVLHAYLGMLKVGKNGYRNIANIVHKSVEQCTAYVKKEPRLTLLGDSPANVIAFKISDSVNWGKGAAYALAHEVSKRKIQLSAVKDDRLHYCVTGRSAGDTKFFEVFSSALSESLDVVESYVPAVKNGEINFPGDAGLYGSMEAALSPSQKNTKSKTELLMNRFLGRRVAEDSVRAHFYALLNPNVMKMPNSKDLPIAEYDTSEIDVSYTLSKRT